MIEHTTCLPTTQLLVLRTSLRLQSASKFCLQVRTGAAVFLAGMAQHLPPDDPKVASIVSILKEILRTPSGVVQSTAATALASIAPKLAADPDAVTELVQHFLTLLTTGEKYGLRRGAAFGIAGLVKGLGISALKRQGIMDALKAAVDTKSDVHAKEGGLMAVECLCSTLGRLFEPYIISVLPLLLAAFGDAKSEVRSCVLAAHLLLYVFLISMSMLCCTLVSH